MTLPLVNYKFNESLDHEQSNTVHLVFLANQKDKPGLTPKTFLVQSFQFEHILLELLLHS